MKIMWSEIKDNHLYVYWRGKVIYKKWIDKKGNKTEPSILINEKFPNERIK